MAGPFDATTKHLLEAYPEAWLEYLGLATAAPITVLDADLATVSPEADKVLRVGAATPWLLHMDERIGREATPAEAAMLWSATYVLMGLRYPPGVAQQLLQGVRAMRESSTYQAILDEGRIEGRTEGRLEEAKAIILRQGRRRFGPPDARWSAMLDGITDLDRIERLSERLLDVSSWEELLSAP